MGLRTLTVGVLGLIVLAAVSLATGAPTDPRFIDSGPRGRAEIWAVGDGADGGQAGGRVARTIARARPDRFLYLGDVYERGSASEFARNYAPKFGRFDDIAAPTIGNHEFGNEKEGYGPYWAKALGMTPPPYFAFRVAGWQILSLNSEIDHDRDSRQLDWLRRKTQRPGRCRIAFWHRPRFSAGTDHGDAPDIEPLYAALRGKARLILNGHEHNMQRLALAGGLTELVAGAGGRGLTTIDHSYGKLRFGDDRHYGAVRLRVRPGRANYAFVVPSGRVLNRGVVRCR